MTVSTNLGRIRAARRLSVEQVAHRSGITTATIRRIERGEVNPHARTLDAIARALRVSVMDLTQSEVFVVRLPRA